MGAKRIVRGVLLAFVAVSIAVAVIKESTARSSSVAPGTVDGDGVIVYYMHTTFRCATCNRVEATADKLIRGEFAEPLTNGRLQWVSVDYQQYEEMAVRYEIGGNMIVVVRLKDGKEVQRTRLANVMDLAIAGKWDQLENDVRQAVRACLAGA